MKRAGSSTSSGPQQADLLKRYKDLALEMEERSLAAERKCSLAEARIESLERSLKDAQEALKTAQKNAARCACGTICCLHVGQHKSMCMQQRIHALEAHVAALGLISLCCSASMMAQWYVPIGAV